MSDEKKPDQSIMAEPKKPMPIWAKYALAGMIGGGAVGGMNKAATDSPIHFAVEGEAPAGADADWICAPEGGLIGAPVVCRPKAEVVEKIKAWKAIEQSNQAATSTDNVAE